MNMQALMNQAKQMQKEITKVQQEIENTEFIGNNGLVTVKMMGNKLVKEVKIEEDKEILDDLSILQDMIILATNDAINKINKKTEEKLGKYSSMMPGIM